VAATRRSRRHRHRQSWAGDGAPARRRFGTAIEFAVTTKFGIVWAVQTAFDPALSHQAVFALAERDPTLSARTVFTPEQLVFVFTVLTVVLAGLAIAPLATLVVLNLVMGMFYLGNSSSRACWSRSAAGARPNAT
jgi:hypothetical protein